MSQTDVHQVDPDAPAEPTDGIDVALRDGSTVRVRPVRKTDEERIATFLSGLSERSRVLRFFSAGADLADQARRFATLDPEIDYGLVATAGASGEIVGHAGYNGESNDSAEVAFAIGDAYQGRGLATTLLAHLASHAHEHGITTFSALTRPDNHMMIEVFRESGFPVEVRSGADIVAISCPTELGEAGWERFEQRDRMSSVAAVDAILAPKSVALIGASRRRGTVGGEILHNLVANNFQGVVYPVNPTASFIQSMPAYASVTDVPTRPDLAVIAVPASGVLDVARECGIAGVRGLVVVSAGFAEVGGEGSEAQRELLEICRAYGMRIVGPNCIGVLNTAPDVQLDATFIPLAPRHGSVGFLSQSGGLGIAIVQAANRLRLGLSAFVSVGNKVDLSGNDFIQYWEHDPNTNVILLYLESFGNARKFSRVARRVGRTKPIVAVKSGRSAAGARATSSHTGALLATSDVTVDALFRQSGVIRTDTLGELFDVAMLLSSQPAPRGPRVVIFTNGGGPGILAADACEAAGLEVVELPEKLREELRAVLPAEASVTNPIDVIATASADAFRQAVETVGRADVADALIVIYVPTLVNEPSDVAAAISAASEQLPPELPLTAVFMVEEELELHRGEQSIPRFAFPEDAARALGHAAGYGAWRNSPVGEIPRFADCRPDEAAAVIAHALGTGAGWLEAQDVATLLDCYGLRTPAARFVADSEAAALAAAEIGGTVALKAMAPGLVHKSDVGAVATGLRPAQVARAASRMTASVEQAGFKVDGFHVQAMAPHGVELIVGVVQDRAFGPLIAAGAGGTSTELLGDVQARLTPLTDLDAREMLRSLRLFPLLDGYRGAPRCDVAALEELLLRVSALVEDHPEVAEMDLNPVVALPEGPLAIDARVRLETPPPLPVRPSVKA
ncbi:MAG: GNAT family N-acetyltransferase [Solirubrobacteraceae bacterium]